MEAYLPSLAPRTGADLYPAPRRAARPVRGGAGDHLRAGEPLSPPRLTHLLAAQSGPLPAGRAGARLDGSQQRAGGTRGPAASLSGSTGRGEPRLGPCRGSRSWRPNGNERDYAGDVLSVQTRAVSFVAIRRPANMTSERGNSPDPRREVSLREGPEPAQLGVRPGQVGAPCRQVGCHHPERDRVTRARI